MDPIIWILILVAAGSLIAVFTLFKRSPAAAPDDAEEENDRETGGLEEEEPEADDGQEDEDDWEDNEDGDELIEETPLTSETAKVTDLRVEQRPPGLYVDPRDQLKFMADFKIFKGKKKSYSRSIEIPEELYEKLKVGESATLITQGNLFVDFGDRYAESVEN